MAVSKNARGLTGTVLTGERQFMDRLGLIPEEMRPEEVRSRINQAQAGYLGPLQEMYMLMETDARYRGLLKQLRSAVASCPVKAKPAEKKGRGAKKAYELVKDNYRRLNLPRTIRQMTQPHVRGVCVWRNLWTIENSSVMGGDTAFFRGLEPVAGSRLLMINDPTSEFNGQLGIQSMDHPAGRPVTDYQPGALLVGMDEEAEKGYYDLAGTARSCLGWWLAKGYTKTFWGEHNQTFGEPVRMAFVPDGTDPEQVKKLERFMKFMGRHMYGIFDEDIDVQLQNAVNTGTVSTYKEMIMMANDEISIATVGQVLTSDGGSSGSYAKAAVHFQVQRLIVIAICQMIKELLYEINLTLCQFNISEDFDPEDLPSYGPVVPRSEDKKTLADMYSVATSLVKVKLSQIRDDLELETPEDDDETIGPEDKSAVAGPAVGGAGDPPKARSATGKPNNSVGDKTDSDSTSIIEQVPARGQLDIFDTALVSSD